MSVCASPLLVRRVRVRASAFGLHHRRPPLLCEPRGLPLIYISFSLATLRFGSSTSACRYLLTFNYYKFKLVSK